MDTMTATTEYDFNEATQKFETVSLDAVLSKIAKIWRQANHPNTSDAEREVFERKALALMEAHRITEAMLDLGYEDVLVDELVVKLTGRDARLSIDLLDAIARAFGCRVYWQGYGLTYNTFLFGFKSDIERVKGLYTMLEATCATGAACLKGYDMAHTKSLRRGFRQGFASAIASRLRAAKQEAHDEQQRQQALEALFGPEALDPDLDWSAYEEEIAAAARDTQAAKGALVLVEKGKRVESEYGKKKLRHAAGTRSGAYEGRAAGRAAGERANLNRSAKVGSGSRGALSA